MASHERPLAWIGLPRPQGFRAGLSGPGLKRPFNLEDGWGIGQMLDCTSALAFYRILFLRPSRNALPEHLHVPIALLLENLVGQTRLVDWTGSVEDYEPGLRDLSGASIELRKRDVHGASDMRVPELLWTPDIHEHEPPGRLLQPADLVRADELRSFLAGARGRRGMRAG